MLSLQKKRSARHDPGKDQYPNEIFYVEFMGYAACLACEGANEQHGLCRCINHCTAPSQSRKDETSNTVDRGVKTILEYLASPRLGMRFLLPLSPRTGPGALSLRPALFS